MTPTSAERRSVSAEPWIAAGTTVAVFAGAAAVGLSEAPVWARVVAWVGVVVAGIGFVVWMVRRGQILRSDGLDELAQALDRLAAGEADVRLVGSSATRARVLAAFGRLAERHRAVLLELERPAAPPSSPAAESAPQRSVETETTAVRRSPAVTDATRARLLARIRHDVRQPLQALGLFVAALPDTRAAAAQPALHGEIAACVADLEVAISVALDFVRADSGTLQADVREIPIGPLLYKAHLRLARRAQDKGLSMRVVPTSLAVESDPDLLEALVFNLLAHAIANTQSGGIVIGCRRAGSRFFRLEIRDSGDGRSEDALSSLRTAAALDTDIPDGQRVADNPPAAQQPEVPLATAALLSHALGVRMQIRSTPGRGSQVTLRLRRAMAASSSTDPESEVDRSRPVDLSSALVLVIDDTAAIRTALQELIPEWGGRVLAAASTGEAIAALDRSGLTPDIVLCDLRLPGQQDGIEAIGAVQARYGRAIPGLLLTGDTSVEAAERAHLHGLRILHKPIQPARLRAVLVARLPAIGTARASSSAPLPVDRHSAAAGRNADTVLEHD